MGNFMQSLYKLFKKNCLYSLRQWTLSRTCGPRLRGNNYFFKLYTNYLSESFIYLSTKFFYNEKDCDNILYHIGCGKCYDLHEFLHGQRPCIAQALQTRVSQRSLLRPTLPDISEAQNLVRVIYIF